MQAWQSGGQKRKRDMVEDGAYGGGGEAESSYGGNQVLPVAHLPQDFNGEPEDGAQYLAMVRRDARSRPHTTRVANPYAATLAAPAPLKATTIESLLPSQEWRTVFEQRFREFRKNIRHTPIYVGPPPERVQLPRWTDREAWWAFINNFDPPRAQTKQFQSRAPPPLDAETIEALVYGSDDDLLPTSRDQAPARIIVEVPDEQSDGEIVDDENVNGTGETEPSAPLPREPSRALLECINHRVCMQVLKYYKHWVERAAARELMLRPAHGRWMFALLAHIDEQLLADEMSILRQVAKACISLLKVDLDQGEEADSADEGEASDSTGIGRSACWLVVGAVALGFAQRDLWDEAANVLSA
ncbi:hypothetical protein EXIGLDRAFT_828151 [Exidia glandulosa HHB12029]|uniref:Gem-associated protein 2 n=1 Tax=Exidia glandulosa HHB12029 TaxID=1314781 RepID=A0A165QYA0_EXIGL|nr:hypothetical protein EXIGLDRAFT_828151 [Exidia glandulosa HHB12029]